MRILRWFTLALALGALALGGSVGQRTVALSHSPGHGGGGSTLMGRLRTVGFEIGQGNDTLEGKAVVGGNGASVSQDTITVRSGGASLKMVSGTTTSDVANTQLAFAGAVSTTYFVRAYFRFSSFPVVSPAILAFTRPVTSPIGYVRLTALKTLRLIDVNGFEVGAESPVLSANVWHQVELAVRINNGTNNDYLEARLDGVSFASSNTLGLVATPPTGLAAGWVNAAPPSFTMNVDDLALNDETGASQNSWPGGGSIVLLKPISDAQVGSWTGGVGGATNLFDAVNNTPPVGTATETNLTQIESADSSGDNSTDEYRANLTSYSSAGILTGEPITLCQAVADHGEDIATGAKTGSFLILSNPAQGVGDTFTFGDDVGALGTWPTNWRAKWGAAQHNPSVTLGTSPVLRIRKTDAGTRVASVDFMGIYVEYVPTAVSPIMSPLGDVFSPL